MSKKPDEKVSALVGMLGQTKPLRDEVTEGSQAERVRPKRKRGKPPSKRQLVREGEYVQLAVLLPRDTVKRFKRLEFETEGKDLSDLAAEALEDYLSKHDA